MSFCGPVRYRKPTSATSRLISSDGCNSLAREFSPVFAEGDFVNLPRYHLYVRLLIDGVPSKGFSAVTLPLQETKAGNAAQIIALSRARYGRPASPANASAVTQRLPLLG